MSVRLDERIAIETTLAKGSFCLGASIGAALGALFGFAIALSLSVDIKQNYHTLKKGGLDRGYLQYEHNDKGEAILEWTGDERDSTTTGPAREAENAQR